MKVMADNGNEMTSSKRMLQMTTKEWGFGSARRRQGVASHHCIRPGGGGGGHSGGGVSDSITTCLKLPLTQPHHSTPLLSL